MTEKLYITVREAAQMLSCSPRAVYDLIRQGRLPAIRLGKGKKFSRIRILKSALLLAREEAKL